MTIANQRQETKVVRRSFRRLDLDGVRAKIGRPEGFVSGKKLPALGPFAQRFIGHAPFLCIATSDGDGNADCSPRGDRPGFVLILDDRTIVIPDRPGNRIADSISNLLENPQVGLFFTVPGLRETLRVNGRAYVTDDPDLLGQMSAGGKPALLGIVVEIQEAFVHCGKAMVRSGLWEESSRGLGAIVTGGRPSGMVLAFTEINLAVAADQLEQSVQAGFKTGLN